jgi:hypothetical protein
MVANTSGDTDSHKQRADRVANAIAHWWDTCPGHGGCVWSMLLAGFSVVESQNRPTQQFVGSTGLGLKTRQHGFKGNLDGNIWCHHGGCVKAKQLCEDCVTVRSKFQYLVHFPPS